MFGGVALMVAREQEAAKELEKKIIHALETQNIQFFAQHAWWGESDLNRIFCCAVCMKSPHSIMTQIIRAKIIQGGFTHTFNLLLTNQASIECLQSLLQYKKPKTNIVAKRFSPQKKSILHMCASANCLPWLQYFIETLEFHKYPACWHDSQGNGLLYHAAKNDALQTARYLVEVHQQSPHEKNEKKYSKSPMEIAKGTVREYFQNCNFQHYASGSLQQHEVYQLTHQPERAGNNNNESVERSLVNEKTPLLVSHTKK